MFINRNADSIVVITSYGLKYGGLISTLNKDTTNRFTNVPNCSRTVCLLITNAHFPCIDSDAFMACKNRTITNTFHGFTLQQEHSLLTGPYIVLLWPSMSCLRLSLDRKFSLKLKQNFLTDTHYKTICKTNRSECSSCMVGFLPFEILHYNSQIYKGDTVTQKHFRVITKN